MKANFQVLSWIKFLLGWPLSIISVLFIVKLVSSQSNRINIDFQTINSPLLLLGFVMFFVYYFFRNFLWWYQLVVKGYEINFKENTYRFTFSELKRYTPGNVWSFLSRASQFGELGIDKKTVGITILGDIQLVIIGCGLISLIAYPWLLSSSQELHSKLGQILPLSLLAIIIFFSTTAYIYKRRYEPKSSVASNILLPGYDLGSKLKLTGLSLITYFTFGLASFFVFSAIFHGGNFNPIVIISFFVFSLLAGYLSFIAPTGLGVREAVVTLGLSKITDIGTAGFISIFSRIILILSELIFISIVLLWHKTSSKK